MEVRSESILRRLSPKTLTRVGWVEERNPTFGWLSWVSQSLNPTYDFLKARVYCIQTKSALVS
jgi:hypothetical protein